MNRHRPRLIVYIPSGHIPRLRYTARVRLGLSRLSTPAASGPRCLDNSHPLSDKIRTGTPLFSTERRLRNNRALRNQLFVALPSIKLQGPKSAPSTGLYRKRNHPLLPQALPVPSSIRWSSRSIRVISILVCYRAIRMCSSVSQAHLACSSSTTRTVSPGCPCLLPYRRS